MSLKVHTLSDSDLSDTDSSPVYKPKTNSQAGSKKGSQARKRRKKVDSEDNDEDSNKISKAEKLKVKEKYKHISPATCLNYISLAVDDTLVSNSLFNNVIQNLEELQVPFKTVRGKADSITWIRQQITGEYTEEPHILILWDHITLLRNIEKCTVDDYFLQLKQLKPDQRAYLVIYGLRDYCKRIRKKNMLSENEKNLIKPSRDLVEQIFCGLQLTTGISHILIDEPLELFKYIKCLTKSVAEEPYRILKAKNEMEKTSYLQGNSRSCVKIDKELNGMTRLWQQQLAELPKSSLDCAKAISSLYPSPYSLYQAFASIPSKLEREKLLQNITIGREGSTKRLGPEMSKKISALFTENCEE